MQTKMQPKVELADIASDIRSRRHRCGAIGDCVGNQRSGIGSFNNNALTNLTEGEPKEMTLSW